MYLHLVPVLDTEEGGEASEKPVPATSKGIIREHVIIMENGWE